jgi:hypothetical protein
VTAWRRSRKARSWEAWLILASTVTGIFGHWHTSFYKKQKDQQSPAVLPGAAGLEFFTCFPSRTAPRSFTASRRSGSSIEDEGGFYLVLTRV